MFGGVGRIITQKAPEFPEELKWLNTTKPHSLAELKGNVVIIDFWTYCCINCMHMLPALAKLEDAYRKEPVVVIGVHSAKFTEEQKPGNIMEAIQRYGIRHPVLVDEHMHVWKEYGASAWPTTVIIDPTGNIVYKKPGERSETELGEVVEMLLEKHTKNNTLAKQPFRIDRPAARMDSMLHLSYPGKISFSPDGRKFALSDSNHNRVLIVETESGGVLDVIGTGRRGFVSGKFGECMLFRPQGVLWHGDTVYIADTENHAVRTADLKAGTLATIAGTGAPGGYYPFEYSGLGANTEINSPWDLAFADNRLIIAMAGMHQLWAYEPKSGYAFPYAGNGRENIVDGELQNAEFAQPSGLFADNDHLYVADSEASGIRSIDIRKRFVSTLIGTGLFIFGKSDGSLAEARLQHPLGICAKKDTAYVADTYNSAIRMIDLKKDVVSTVIGAPQEKSMCRFGDDDCDTLGLWEPSDVKIQGNTLYIADTNNHSVRTFELGERMLKTLELKFR